MTATAPADLWPDVRPDAARRLMLAGLRSFAERGFHATTTRHIATGAGMSPAALYVYFPSKVGLLFAISRSGHEHTLAMVTAAVAKDTDPVAGMRHLVAAFVAWHAEWHTVARVVQYELHALPEQEFAVIADLRRRIEQVFRDQIATGVAAGVFDVADVRTSARAVLSLGIDVARWYGESAKTTPVELGARYTDLVLRMLGVAS